MNDSTLGFRTSPTYLRPRIHATKHQKEAGIDRESPKFPPRRPVIFLKCGLGPSGFAGEVKTVSLLGYWGYWNRHPFNTDQSTL